MNSLEKMLQKAKQDPIDHSAPLPLVDKAFDVINNDDLTFTEKKIKIDVLEQQASGYELTCFSDVHEALLVNASMAELSALDEAEQD